MKSQGRQLARDALAPRETPPARGRPGTTELHRGRALPGAPGAKSGDSLSQTYRALRGPLRRVHLPWVPKRRPRRPLDPHRVRLSGRRGTLLGAAKGPSAQGEGPRAHGRRQHPLGRPRASSKGLTQGAPPAASRGLALQPGATTATAPNPRHVLPPLKPRTNGTRRLPTTATADALTLLEGAPRSGADGPTALALPGPDLAPAPPPAGPRPRPAQEVLQSDPGGPEAPLFVLRV